VVLAIPELDVRFLHNRVGDSRSEGRTSLDPAPATRRYKEHHCRINTHEIAIYSGGGFGKAERRCWRSQDSIADSSTNPLANSRSKGTASLGSTPATRRYNLRLLRISIQGVRHPSESGLLSLTILNLMADSSTAAQPILNLSLGRHWALRQLQAGIKRVLRCQFSMELYGPGGGKRGGDSMSCRLEE